MRHIVLLMALLVSGCVSSGPAFNKTMLDNSTVIVYRMNEFTGSAGTYPIEINGKNACDLHFRAFYTIDNPNKLVIGAQLWHEPGVSRITINPTNGTQYVRIRMDNSKQLTAFLGGQLSVIGQEAISESKGPFILSKIPESQALRELEGLKRDCE